MRQHTFSPVDYGGIAPKNQLCSLPPPSVFRRKPASE